jgi:hypothetical protein
LFFILNGISEMHLNHIHSLPPLFLERNALGGGSTWYLGLDWVFFYGTSFSDSSVVSVEWLDGSINQSNGFDHFEGPVTWKMV